ncbi:Mitochondrial dicarboxylate transporter [Podospora pseudopauciseta]|uniref:Mitochondrial dicarboxylate transporter n=2 Tax=Podospora TaxID=5144 RepID=A0ABR0HHV4_9PEZI|nr:Mitochondrial dicarboxylate transporter [Podospora pseudopauciseta]KAK4678628.1 Mitochondrial dicarboxylate transporter [Podospora pseudoanserina]
MDAKNSSVPTPVGPSTETTSKRDTTNKMSLSPQLKQKPIHYPFWFGGSASSMAACVTHPLDLVKVRLQTRSGSMPTTMSGTFLHILRNNGLTGLYSGLSASLLRQITYSTTRFGIYEELKSQLATRSGVDPVTQKPKPPSLPMLIAMASVSGTIGGIAGNAADVLNVRMQHDASLPEHKRRNYRHAGDGLVRMIREEGVGALFRGVGPNSLRAAAMTASQLASYDIFKRTLIKVAKMEDNLATHFSSSFLAGVVAATVTSPIDVIKTRVMSAHGNQGLGQLLGEIYAKEGMGWMFRGWVPSFLRLGPQTICTFLFLESHRKFYRRVKGLEEEELPAVNKS